MPTAACEDAEVISRRLRAIRGQTRGICPKWADVNFSSLECWCHAGGSEGQTLPCPHPRPDDWQTPQGMTAADYAR